MTELIIKMTSWLVAAMLLGFMVSWLLSRIIYKRKEAYTQDTFLAVILERNNMIDKLEKRFQKKRIMFDKLVDKLKDSEKSLAEKTSLLRTLKNKQHISTPNENSSLLLKEKNKLLRMKIQKLEEADIKRVKELEDFEEILLLAEAKNEKNEKEHNKIVKKLDNDVRFLTLENEKNLNSMKLYEKKITIFEEELKLYKAESSDPEFIISKDQFIKIEEQLSIYQKEITSLKNENLELLLKSQKSFNGLNDDNLLEDKAVNAIQKEGDDRSMVKAFRETYKKITNS